MSVAWITLNDSALNAASVAGKVAKIRAIAVTKAMPDPVPPAIVKITAELRGVIGFSGKYLVDQDATTLPPTLVEMAVAKIVRAMSKAVSLPLSEDERADERTYEARLEKLRKGEWPVETPANATPAPQVAAGGNGQFISGTRRVFTKRGMDGL